jgi:hypothetical protein
VFTTACIIILTRTFIQIHVSKPKGCDVTHHFHYLPPWRHMVIKRVNIKQIVLWITLYTTANDETAVDIDRFMHLNKWSPSNDLYGRKGTRRHKDRKVAISECPVTE